MCDVYRYRRSLSPLTTYVSSSLMALLPFCSWQTSNAHSDEVVPFMRFSNDWKRWSAWRKRKIYDSSAVFCSWRPSFEWWIQQRLLENELSGTTMQMHCQNLCTDASTSVEIIRTIRPWHHILSCFSQIMNATVTMQASRNEGEISATGPSIQKQSTPTTLASIFVQAIESPTTPA